MARRRTWQKMEDGRRVYAAKSDEVDGWETYGSYDPATGDITVVYDVPDVMRRKLFHELGHKFCHGMNGRDKEAIFGPGLTEEEYGEREEALCCFLEGKPFDVLTRNGWLKLPKPPQAK